MLDIFNSNAFSIVSLTDLINKIDYIPGRIGELGIFTETRSAQTSVAIEERSGVLVLIPPTERGAPGNTMPRGARTMRAVKIPHFEVNDYVYAEEVQGVRLVGSENQLETVAAKLAERDAAIQDSFSITQEFNRLGALKGVVTYADGTTLDLFDLFGVTQSAEIDFDLDNATPVDGALLIKTQSVIELIVAELGGLPFTGVRAFCGKTFYQQLVTHPEVRDLYKGWQGALSLQASYLPLAMRGNAAKIFGSFEYGGVSWERYRGNKADGTPYVADTKAHFFPEGVPGFARTVYGPADYIDTVNTLGERLVQRQYPMNNNKGIHLDTQMNSLEYITRPKALIVGRNT